MKLRSNNETFPSRKRLLSTVAGETGLGRISRAISADSGAQVVMNGVEHTKFSIQHLKKVVRLLWGKLSALPQCEYDLSPVVAFTNIPCNVDRKLYFKNCFEHCNIKWEIVDGDFRILEASPCNLKGRGIPEIALQCERWLGENDFLLWQINTVHKLGNGIRSFDFTFVSTRGNSPELCQAGESQVRGM